MSKAISAHTKVDLVNIGLILISFVLAVSLPIRVFLFSYIILGPLHYLTEIGWLNKRNFFAKQRQDVWLLVGITFLITLSFYFFVGFDIQDIDSPFLKSIYTINQSVSSRLIFVAFFTAIAIVFAKKKSTRYIVIAISVLCAMLMHFMDTSIILFGIFVPTIIHVSLFTAAFMLYGTLKSKSIWGYIAVVLFCLGWIACFFIYKNPAQISATSSTMEILLESTFIHLGATLSESMGLRSEGSDYLLMSKLGIQFQTLFAFCYTYHYLNWFSKTKIINWHEVSRGWLVATGVIWILALVIYAIDYKIGFMALFFLSMLHVVLEFPLNNLSFYGIYDEIKSRL